MKLKRVTRIDSIPAGSTSFDEQGFLHDTPVVTSIGIFEYSLPDGGTRRELRLPEHVFDKESLASYAGKPVIITHKAGGIDKDNVMKEIVGTILSEGFQDGNNVRCKIVIHDIDKVKKIPYRELSLGYSLDLVEEPGEWNGEPYDAIQTNIRINHLAIVEKARAGEQAHLNLDGKNTGGADDIQNHKGGKAMGNEENHGDSIDMTPEELLEAIKAYKASKSGGADPAGTGSVQEVPATKDGGPDDETKTASGEIPEPTGIPAPPDGTGVSPGTPFGNNPAGEKEVKQDGDISSLIAAVEQLLAAVKASQEGAGTPPAGSAAHPGTVKDSDDECLDNDDSSDDQSQSMNNDSADVMRGSLQEKLEICRVGDKLNMDGLEGKSVMEGKKAIIAKVLPNIRLDGKEDAYINAAYDLAVSQVSMRKDVAYQKRQMMNGGTAANRLDGSDSETMAESSRRRMIERESREGGNE